MAQFTPGPWVYEVYRKDDGSLAKVTTVAHCGEYVVGLSCNYEGGDYRYDPSGEPEDDARLIAAAPDLLAACKRALTLLEPFDDPELSLGLGSEALTPLRAAIAKAEGSEVTP